MSFPIATLTKLLEPLSGFSPAIFDGSLSDSQRQTLIERFQEAEEPKVLLMSVKAGGVGLTLTRANHVFHFDHWWNPAVARQAEGRAHRIGQAETVFVYDIYTNGTIEEKIRGLLAMKQQLFDEVIDDLSSDYIKGQITDEELFGLFDLDVPEPLKERSRASGAENQAGRQGMSLSALKPKEFEQLVAKLYEKMGFTVRTTPQSHDGGVDVVARRAMDIGVDYLIIQCKHYPDGSVGEPVIRELMGTKQAQNEATRAVIVTSGKFSEGAIRLAQQFRIDLVDGLSLSALLKKHRLA